LTSAVGGFRAIQRGEHRGLRAVVLCAALRPRSLGGGSWTLPKAAITAAGSERVETLAGAAAALANG
jgi:hypothetical protein